MRSKKQQLKQSTASAAAGDALDSSGSQIIHTSSPITTADGNESGAAFKRRSVGSTVDVKRPHKNINNNNNNKENTDTTQLREGNHSSLQTGDKESTSSDYLSAATDSGVRFEVPLSKLSILSEQQRRRRSSFSLRGKRKSSFGEIQMVLHPDVPAESFCNHISPELPDPLRLRQLLIYCFQRYMDINNLPQQLQNVLESIHQDLLMKKINTSWYHRPMISLNKSLVLQKNPENQELSERISDYQKALERLSNEEQIWCSVLNSKNDLISRLESGGIFCDSANNFNDFQSFQESGKSNDQWSRLATVIARASETLPSTQQENQRVSLELLCNHIDCAYQRLHTLRSRVDDEKHWVEGKFRKLLDSTWPDDISWDDLAGDSGASQFSVNNSVRTESTSDWIRKCRRRKSEANLVAMDRISGRNSITVIPENSD